MKKRMYKLMSLFMAAAIGLTAVPAAAMANEAEEIHVSVSDNDILLNSADESVSGNFAKEDVKETEEVKTYSLEELMGLNVMSLSEEECNEYFANAADEDIWVTYSAMSDEEKEYVSSFFVFNHMVSVGEYEKNEDGCFETDEITEMDYLSYLKEMYGTERNAYKKSGYCYIGAYFPDTQNDASMSQKVSLSCTGGDTKKAFKVTIALQAPSEWVYSYAYYTLNKTTAKTVSNSNGNYTYLFVPLSFHGKGGFSYQMEGTKTVKHGNAKYAIVNKADTTATGYERWNANADFTDTVYLWANIWENSTMGDASSGTVAGKVYMKRMPISYTMAYNVNGGGGSVASQVCTYMKTYSFPGGPVAPNFTVSYDGNGGVANQASASVPRKFLGWNTNSAAASGYTGNFANASMQQGAVLTYYAIWGAGNSSVTFPSASKSYAVSYNGNGGTSDQASAAVNATFLGWGTTPTSGVNVGGSGASFTPNGNVRLYAQYRNGSVALPRASKKGYTFDGWYTAASGGTKVGSAGASFTPSSATTLFAHWSPCNYTVKFDSNGGNPIADISASYDTKFTLVKPERAGYSFKGWQSETSLYQAGEVSNMTDVNGGIVSLKAVWEAVDSTYTVKRLVNDVHDGEYREMTKEEQESWGVKGTEELSGLTDSTIPVPAGDIKGYETPDLQMVTVSADGKAEVIFYYNKIKEASLGGGNTYIDNSVTNNGNTTVDNKDVLAALSEIKSLSQLNSEQIKAVKTIISSNMAISSETASKLYDLIHASSALSEMQKKELLTAIANGYLTDEQKKMLLSIVGKSSLSETDKQALLGAIKSMSNLTMEQQKKILEALESGSFSSYKVDGVTFSIMKNEDGTLTVLLKNMNGQSAVTIPDSVTLAGKAYPITQVAKEAFYNHKELEKIVIGNNVSKIGNSAFEGCSNLKSVTLGAGLKEIGKKAFKNCNSLTTISIPKSVVTIGESAFEKCIKLKTVTLHEGLLQIGKKAFYNCGALTKVKIPRSVLKIGSYAYGKCKKLKTVTFAADSLLTTLDGGVFADCKALVKIKIPARVTSIPAKTFYNDGKLKSCSGGTGVTKIGDNAFLNCKSLTSFTIQKNVQTVGKKAFYNCGKLSKVTIKTKALTVVGTKAFKNCKKKIRFSVSADKKEAYRKLLKNKY